MEHALCSKCGVEPRHPGQRWCRACRAQAAADKRRDYPAPRTRKLSSLTPDPRNANKGTKRGREMLRASLAELGAGRSILLDKHGTIIAGNKTYEAAGGVGLENIRIIQTEGKELVAVQRMDLDLAVDVIAMRLAIADNRTSELDMSWDLDALGLIHADVDLSSFFGDGDIVSFIAGGAARPALAPTGSLADRFGLPPFSVLDARQGYWQNRKKLWLALGIKSEVGRGGGSGTPPHPPTVTRNGDGTLNYGGTAGQDERFDRQRQANASPSGSARPAMDYRNGERGDGTGKPLTNRLAQGGAGANTAWTGVGGAPREEGASGTSIFDPVLCELAYRWFAPRGGSILDPFAGGSVRGVVASLLGYAYTGIDLRAEQVAANRAQGDTLCAGAAQPPRWIVGDSREITTLAPEPVDLIFSCPPYADLERYSNDPADLSTLPYRQFIEAYRLIIAAACERLKPNRFACFVVGDVRDKRGLYQNFPGETIRAFEDAGMRLYNEAILVTSVGSLSIRVGKQFVTGRKLGKTHQNVLVFFKGDPKLIRESFGDDCQFGDISGGDAVLGADGIEPAGD